MAVELTGYDQGQRVRDRFNGKYSAHNGDDPYWHTDKHALSINWRDHRETSIIQTNFLRMVESGVIPIARIGSRALDIGSGTGHDAIRLYKLGYDKVEGIDISDESIILANHLADEFVDWTKRKDVTFTRANLFAYLGDGPKRDYIGFRGVGDYLDFQDQELAFKLIQNETAVNGINVISVVTDEPRSLVGRSTVPCHDDGTLHPVPVDKVKSLYSEERGWKTLLFETVENKEDFSHPEGRINPGLDSHSHSHLYGIFQKERQVPHHSLVHGRSASGLIVPSRYQNPLTIGYLRDSEGVQLSGVDAEETNRVIFRYFDILGEIVHKPGAPTNEEEQRLIQEHAIYQVQAYSIIEKQLMKRKPKA